MTGACDWKGPRKDRAMTKKTFIRPLGGRKGAGIRKLSRMLCAITAAAVLTGCRSPRVIFTREFGEDEVFRIEDETCTLAETAVYLADMQNQYENVYGDGIWDVALEGVTLEENVKEMVLAKIAQIKTMCLLAREKEVSLTDEEKDRADQAAETYFLSLTEEEAKLLGTDRETLGRMYREYALADKVYQYMIRDVNPEISDDEARTITVQHIFLRTYTTDGTGARVAYTEELKQHVYDRACQIREMALAGDQSFLDLASRYSEDTNVTCSFCKGEREAAFEEAAFQLETDEISPVVETESGYHIIKCISTFDREQTDANKLVILEERRREAFGQEYDAFAETLNRSLNQELWQQVTLPDGNLTRNPDFFGIYEEFFP